MADKTAALTNMRHPVLLTDDTWGFLARKAARKPMDTEYWWRFGCHALLFLENGPN